MNTPSNGVPESPLDAPAMAPATLSPTRPLYWSIRRELWENRSIYIAPLVVAAIVLFGILINTINLPGRLRTLDPAKHHAAIVTPYNMAPTPIMLAAFLVGIFYALDALHGERRDRSILFWKSLPVSDLTIVLSKASVPLVVLPLIALALGVATQLIVLLLRTAVLLGNGLSAAPLWAELLFLQDPLVQLYGLTVHALWFAPIYGWLLLVSAWAGRTPFLWAVLPPLALGAVERIAFQTSYFGSLMRYRVIGAMGEAFAAKGMQHSNFTLKQLDPLGFLGTPGLWIGLVVAAGFLAAAVRLRRNREPI
jgi:ABC-2 type transport system permease protein